MNKHTSQYKHFSSPLNKMIKLLERVGRSAAANNLNHVVKMLDINPEDAINYMLGSEFWGGSGSYIDTYFASENCDISDDFQRDNLHLAHLLYLVMLNLRKEGYDTTVMQLHFQELKHASGKYLQNYVKTENKME